MFIDFRERKGERETSMWKRNIDQLTLVRALIEDQTRSLGMCSDRGLNPQPFVV